MCLSEEPPQVVGIEKGQNERSKRKKVKIFFENKKWRSPVA